jgi:hypothetical protein
MTPATTGPVSMPMRPATAGAGVGAPGELLAHGQRHLGGRLGVVVLFTGSAVIPDPSTAAA